MQLKCCSVPLLSAFSPLLWQVENLCSSLVHGLIGLGSPHQDCQFDGWINPRIPVVARSEGNRFMWLRSSSSRKVRSSQKPVELSQNYRIEECYYRHHYIICSCLHSDATGLHPWHLSLVSEVWNRSICLLLTLDRTLVHCNKKLLMYSCIQQPLNITLQNSWRNNEGQWNHPRTCLPSKYSIHQPWLYVS